MFGEFDNVRMSTTEHQKLLCRFGETVTADYIERLSGWLKDNPRKKSASHYARILAWLRKDRTIERAVPMPAAPLIEAAELAERAKILMNVRKREGLNSSFEDCRAAIMRMDRERGLVS